MNIFHHSLIFRNYLEKYRIMLIHNKMFKINSTPLVTVVTGAREHIVN